MTTAHSLPVPPLSSTVGQQAATRPTWWFRWLLPVIWCSAAYVSWGHPGDEYGLFVVACLPVVWLALLFQNFQPLQALPLIFLAGILTTGLVGWLMDSLRVWRITWLALWTVGISVLLWLAFRDFSSWDRAIAKNGSVAAYVSAATSLSLVLTSIACLLGAALGRLRSWIRSRQSSSITARS